MTVQVAQTITEQETDKRLKDLLHHLEGAKGRWHRLQRFGASDEVLKAAIAFELGIFSGSTRPGEIDICGKGGKSPRIWISKVSSRGRPTLSGKQLVRRVRSLMQIPYPARIGCAGFQAGQSVWVVGLPDELPGQRLIQTWAKGVVEDFKGDRLKVAVAQRRQKRSRQRPIERYEALLKPEEVFAELPDWAGLLPFVEHIRIIENSLLRDLNLAMKQADSVEQCAILEDQELALIDEVSRWARSKGWRLEGRDGQWKCCPPRGQSRKFTPMLRPGDEAIADPLDFRQIYVKRDGRFIAPPKPVQLSLFEGF